MKKGLLLSGLIIAITLLCCCALVAGERVQNSDAALSKETASLKQDPAATQKVDIDELYQRIQELKSQGLYDPQLWADYDNLTSRPLRPPRHTDQGGEDCANATTVGALPYSDGGTLGARDDCATTALPWARPYNDVFYVFTAPSAGDYIFDMCGSNLDTYMRIFTDGVCCSENFVTADDECGGMDPKITLTLTASQVVYIECGYYSNQTTPEAYNFNVTAEEPCEPDYVIPVDCQGYTGQGNTCNAANDCDTRASEDEIWEIEILADGEYNFSLCNTDPYWDSYIYLDIECCGSSHLDSDDDGCGPMFGNSVIECVELTAGTIVYLLVEGYSASDCGAYQLDISCCEPPPPPPECPENTLYGQPVHGPDDSWSAANSDAAPPYIVYESFWEVTAPICDIHWWGFSLFYDFGWYLCDEDPMDFEIIFYPNAAGAYLPDVDNPVCTYNVTLNRQLVGDWGYPLYYWGTTLDPCCDISDGWVSIQGTSVSTPDCYFLWMSSGTGDGNSIQLVDDAFTDTYYDRAFCLTEEVEEDSLLDLGDLHVPCNYPSLPWQNMHPAGNYNPGHLLTNVAWLGASISGELWADPAGHDNNNVYEAAGGDLTDDGVTFYPHTVGGGWGYDICHWENVDVTVTIGARYFTWADTVCEPILYLNAWKDANLDDDFDDVRFCDPAPPNGCGPCDEWIIQDFAINPGMVGGGVPGSYTFAFTFCDPGLYDLTPFEPIFRFRLNSFAVGRHGYGMLDTLCSNMVNGTGPAVDFLGEVEDYNVIEFYQLPVELTTLEAIVGDRQVTLFWTTATEQDNAYFSVLRNGMEIAQVDGSGNSQTAINYEYTDQAVVNGVTYTYRLLSHDINGTVHEYEQTVEATPEAPMPREYALEQNFPNPFNPNTTISYALKEAGFVTLKIYNLLGQNVATLVSQRMESGRYTATFTAKDLPSGIYVYRLDVNDFSATKKMVLMK